MRQSPIYEAPNNRDDSKNREAGMRRQSCVVRHVLSRRSFYKPQKPSMAACVARQGIAHAMSRSERVRPPTGLIRWGR